MGTYGNGALIGRERYLRLRKAILSRIRRALHPEQGVSGAAEDTRQVRSIAVPEHEEMPIPKATM